MARSGKRGSSGRRTLREAAVEVVRRLTEAGHEAYLAGGCVRDRLMGHPPVDYDVATDARPEVVADLLSRVRRVGEAFGVTLVTFGGHQIEVATFRTDGVYSDSRRPDDVTFSDADHDAKRRDFTINGLFEDPLNDRIIDFVGGQADIEAGLIRAIGEPSERLREDRLRMLRAVRFAARFDFTIEPGTAEAIRASAGELPGVSRERIGQEMKLMLSHRSRARAAGEIQCLGLDAPVLDEPNQVVDLTRLEGLPDDAAYPTALAAWQLDRHEAGEPGFQARVRTWSRALMLSNLEASALARCLEVYSTLRSGWADLGVAARKRLAAAPAFDEAMAVLRGIDPDACGTIDGQRAELAATGLAPEPLINGEDLIAMGLEPGPLFARVLEEVYDAQLEGRVRGRDEALMLAGQVAGTAGSGR
jgi:tRNA nucleotidyltransferase/poly(A) polymerase